MKPVTAMHVGLLACALLITQSAHAQVGAVELRQGDAIGSGSLFRHGSDCVALTAEHVVANSQLPIRASDKTGATAAGSVVFADPGNDVALVSIAGASGIGCDARWPDSDWMQSEQFGRSSEFYFIRQDPNGRETLVELRWAGGSPGSLTMSQADRMEVRKADSGSLVYFGDRPVGIVLSIDPATDRIEVRRFDVIHGLVGSRFAGSSDVLVSLESVKHNGRDNPNWLSYVSTWFGQGDAPTMAGAGHPDARCRVSVDILHYDTSSIANPRVEQARADLAGCRNNLLTRNSRNLISLCESGARSTIERAPARINVTSIQMRVVATDNTGMSYQNLDSLQFSHPADTGINRADMEMHVLHESFGELAPPVLRSAGCMKAASTSTPARGQSRARNARSDGTQPKIRWPWQKD